MHRILKPLLPAAALLLAACGGNDDSASRAGGWSAAPRVVTQFVEVRPLVDEIEALGTARANESVDIRPRIASLVESVAFDEGEYVERGDLLVELENREIVAGLALAEASLSESRSLYERSKQRASTNAISASNLEQLLAQVERPTAVLLLGERPRPGEVRHQLLESLAQLRRWATFRHGHDVWLRGNDRGTPAGDSSKYNAACPTAASGSAVWSDAPAGPPRRRQPAGNPRRRSPVPPSTSADPAS